MTFPRPWGELWEAGLCDAAQHLPACLGPSSLTFRNCFWALHSGTTLRMLLLRPGGRLLSQEL